MLSEQEVREINLCMKNCSYEAPRVNFIRVLSTEEGKQCSIVCSYQKSCNYYCFDGNSDSLAEMTIEDGYHGLSPKISALSIINSIKAGSFKDSVSLDSYAKEISDCYMLCIPENENSADCKFMNRRIMFSLFKHTLLTMSKHFGYEFHVCEKTKALLESLIEEHKDCFVPDVNFSISMGKKSQCRFVIIGSPSEKMLEVLQQVFCFTQSDDKSLELALKSDSKSKTMVFSNGTFFKDNERNVVLEPVMLGSHAYYSGVLSRLLHIARKSDSETVGNKSIQPLTLTLMRTTFATLDAFDNYTAINDPILSDADRLNINRFTGYEMKQQNQVFNGEEEQSAYSSGELEKAINSYLCNSFNYNTVAVSASLTTSDRYLIYGLRSSASIDKGTCYCSANGQSEFYDENVTFYQDSVYEDCPTLRTNANGRLDFNKEIARETIAELNSSHFEDDWKYYGISVSGIKYPDPVEAPQRLRFHFNVLSENSISDTLLDICSFQKKAIESFENSEVTGCRFWYSGQENGTKASWIIKAVLNWIMQNFDFVSALYLIFYLVFTRFAGFSFKDRETQLSLVIILCGVAASVSKLVDFIKHRRISRIRTFKWVNCKKAARSTDYINEKVIDKVQAKFAKKAFRRKLIGDSKAPIFHPIAKLMSLLYLKYRSMKY